MMGSTREARRAGNHAAKKATTETSKTIADSFDRSDDSDGVGPERKTGTSPSATQSPTITTITPNDVTRDPRKRLILKPSPERN